MNTETAVVLVAAMIGILLGVQMQRRRATIYAPVGGSPQAYLHATSFWNQFPTVTVPGPPATWALI